MKEYKIITPSITIFDENENIDYDGNKVVIDHLINNGVDGILTLGSSGEFTGLSLEEKKEHFKFYYEYTAGRVDLYSGTGTLEFKETVELTNYTLELGYKAAVVITPYYYALDQEKIFLYFDTLAKRVNGNIFIYNFPARSGNSISSETLYKLLKKNNNIKGLKDSVLEYTHTVDLLREIRYEFPEFELYSGFDDQFLLNISSGGNGAIAALSNIVPEIWRDWVEAANSGNFSDMKRLQKYIDRLMKLYDLDSNFSFLFKKLMKYRGLDIKINSIFPFSQMSDETFNKAKRIFDTVYQEYQDEIK